VMEGSITWIAVLNRNNLYEEYLKPLRMQKNFFSEVGFTITDERGTELIQMNTQDHYHLSKLLEVQEAIPRLSLHIYKKAPHLAAKEIHQKTLWLYTLLAVAMLLMLFGTWMILGNYFREQKLLRMKSNFISSVTHELKTPLTSILMFSDTLSSGKPLPPGRIGDYANIISRESRRLELLIENVLSFSRLERGARILEMRTINLATISDKVIESLDFLYRRKGITLNKKLSEAIIEGDELSIFSLCRNLVENAIKYTPDGGTVEVYTQSTKDSVFFKVKDSGIGIPARARKKIFHEFYRLGDELTRQAKGSGLGLAIVKQIAQLHKAKIELRSKPNEGSEFIVEFQRKKSEQT
jgi:signal transduction histidine kinase